MTHELLIWTLAQVLGGREIHWFWKLLPPVLIAPTWGILTVKLFFAGALAIVCFIIDIVGTLRGKGDRGRSPVVLAVSLLHLALSWGSLYGIDFLLRSVLELDSSQAVRVVYWVGVAIGLLHSLIVEIPDRLKLQWRIANEPGAAVGAFWDEFKKIRRSRWSRSHWDE